MYPTLPLLLGVTTPWGDTALYLISPSGPVRWNHIDNAGIPISEMINQKGQGWGCVLWVTKKHGKRK